jgi:hypothetical protein
MADFNTVLHFEHHGRSVVAKLADLVWETTNGNPHVVLCGDGVFRTLDEMLAHKPVVVMPAPPAAPLEMVEVTESHD